MLFRLFTRVSSRSASWEGHNGGPRQPGWFTGSILLILTLPCIKSAATRGLETKLKRYKHDLIGKDLPWLTNGLLRQAAAVEPRFMDG